jgi:two-component system, LytTR family, response regulator
MKITAILVDDEADNRSVLHNLLKMFCPQVEVCGEASNIETAYHLINQYQPNVVFLDIQMPGGNGFSLLKKFNEVPFDVIFVTGYDKYALEAIKLSALHYLMKPVEVSDLLEAVKRLENTIRFKDSNLQYQNMEHNLVALEKRISLHTNDQVVFIPLNSITHFEGEGNYTTIYTLEKKYTSSKTLGAYEEMISDNKLFYRIGKSCIVNLNCITNYSKGEPCMLTVSNEFTYEISRRKKQELLDRMKR